MSWFSEDYLKFFIELASNNHKEWFDANRDRYHNVVKKPSEAFIQALIDHLQPQWPAGTEVRPRDCLFRINRDIRFSKDKTPYKMQVSAVVSPYGKKDSRPALYVELGPSHLGIYGGVYFIEPDKLLRLRHHIANNLPEFQKLTSEAKFVTSYGEIRGEKNKRLPSPLNIAAEKEERLFNKQFYYFTELDSDLILSDQLLDIVLEHQEIAAPVNKFLLEGMETPSVE